jgi:hypothetical protein
MQTRPSPPRPCRGQWLPAAVIALAVAWACSLLLAASASASAPVTLRPSFGAGSQLGQGTTWTSELTFSGSEYNGHVDPLTGLTIHLPAGTGWSIVGFGTCSKETIEKYGWRACPSDSIAGPMGSLTALFTLGNETFEEQATVQAIFGPAENLYFVVEGQSPIDFTAIMEGRYVSDSPPYGQALVLDVPRVVPVLGAPDMSITALTLNVGATLEEAGTVFHSVFMPNECPVSGFAWAADVVFNGETSAPVNVDFTGPCPGSEIVPVTVQPSSPPSGGSQPSSSTSTGPGSSTTASISTAQIAALLDQQLIPSGKTAKIGALLKGGGVTVSFNALEAGTAVIDWYEMPTGAKLAKHTTAKPILAALGQMIFSAAGTGKLKIRLTEAGKRLLKHDTQLKLTAKGAFTPLGQTAITVTKQFSVSARR